MRARRDGVDLEPEDARELWAHFSHWMDEHPGDLAGFAAALGVKSVRPALDPRGPVLVVSTTETQTAYANARSLEASPKREKGSGAKAPNKGKSQAARPSGAPKPRGPKQPE